MITFLVLPLSVTGVVFGQLVTGTEFGFFSIAGWLGLLGMIIKNVIVLLDEVNVQLRAGIKPYTAIIESTVSRVRPVLMAAVTTILGMVRCCICRDGCGNRVWFDVCHAAYFVCNPGTICCVL